MKCANDRILFGVDYPTGADETFTYDVNGNRLTRNATTYTYNSADQLTVQEMQGGSVTNSHIYAGAKALERAFARCD